MSPLFAESETRFFPIVIGAEIEFFKDHQGKVTHFVLHQGGRDMKAPKNLKKNSLKRQFPRAL